MIITGKVTEISDVTNRETGNGEATKSLTYWLHTTGDHPDQIKVDIWSKEQEKFGFKVDQFLKETKVGSIIEAEVSFRESEYKGKKYMNCNHFKSKVLQNGKVAQSEETKPKASKKDEESSDLPF